MRDGLLSFNLYLGPMVQWSTIHSRVSQKTEAAKRNFGGVGVKLDGGPGPLDQSVTLGRATI